MGWDWLQQNGGRIYSDFGLGDEYVALEEDLHISFIARISRQITLKALLHATWIAKVGLRDNTLANSYEAEQLKSGFVGNL